MLNEAELTYYIALQKTPFVGDTMAKKLIEKLGSAEAIFKEKKSSLQKIEGLGVIKLKHLGDASILDEAKKELAYIYKHQVEAISYKEKNYPNLLKHCIDSPILLFQRGNIDLVNRKVISIVGTRKITSHGTAFCEELVEKLALFNPVIVSGFAYGTDIVAHKAAIKNNLQTIACLAHGLNQLYPKTHQRYVDDVEKNGGFMTDFSTTNSFDRTNFLRRNRIIAGMSETTIVIESAEKGGSLVTADIAHSYDREVFAVPGRTTDKLSLGCNNLIKSQKARMLTSAEDLIYMLNWDIETPKPKQISLFLELSDEQKIITDKLTELGKCELDYLSLACKIPTFKLASMLLELELSGVVRPLPGKQFELI